MLVYLEKAEGYLFDFRVGIRLKIIVERTRRFHRISKTFKCSKHFGDFRAISRHWKLLILMWIKLFWPGRKTFENCRRRYEDHKWQKSQHYKPLLRTVFFLLHIHVNYESGELVKYFYDSRKSIGFYNQIWIYRKQFLKMVFSNPFPDTPGDAVRFIICCVLRGVQTHRYKFLHFPPTGTTREFLFFFLNAIFFIFLVSIYVISIIIRTLGTRILV